MRIAFCFCFLIKESLKESWGFPGCQITFWKTTFYIYYYTHFADKGTKAQRNIVTHSRQVEETRIETGSTRAQSQSSHWSWIPPFADNLSSGLEQPLVLPKTSFINNNHVSRLYQVPGTVPALQMCYLVKSWNCLPSGYCFYPFYRWQNCTSPMLRNFSKGTPPKTGRNWFRIFVWWLQNQQRPRVHRGAL